MALSKDEFLLRSKPAVCEVEIPELGDSVFIRTMTGTQRDKFESMFSDNKSGKKPMENLRGIVCAWVMSDENGNRMYDDKDAAAIGQLDVRVLTRIFDAATEHSALTGDEQEVVAEK